MSAAGNCSSAPDFFRIDLRREGFAVDASDVEGVFGSRAPPGILTALLRYRPFVCAIALGAGL